MFVYRKSCYELRCHKRFIKRNIFVLEIERLEKGEDRKDRVVPMIDVHPQQPQPVALKVRIPVIEYPKVSLSSGNHQSRVLGHVCS